MFLVGLYVLVVVDVPSGSTLILISMMGGFGYSCYLATPQFSNDEVKVMIQNAINTSEKATRLNISEASKGIAYDDLKKHIIALEMRITELDSRVSGNDPFGG